MKLFAKKPCSFNGKKFYIGEEIPADLVMDPVAQEKMGVISIAEGEVAPPAAPPAPAIVPVDVMEVLVPTEEGDLSLNVSKEGLQAIVDVMTGNVENAERVIAEMNDGDALILLHATDGRKSVKAAAEARAKVINGESAGEQ